MYDRINPLERAPQSVRVTNVTKEKANGRKLLPGELLSHFELLELIPAEDNKAFQVWAALVDLPDESFAERSSATR